MDGRMTRQHDARTLQANTSVGRNVGRLRAAPGRVHAPMVGLAATTPMVIAAKIGART
jgi:hypothetical protein